MPISLFRGGVSFINGKAQYEILIDKLDFVSQLFKFSHSFHIIHSISQ